MSVLPIRVLGDPVLRTPAEPVMTFDRDLRRLVKDMVDTMKAADGVGLAAPQVGVGLRVFVYDVPDHSDTDEGDDDDDGPGGRGVVVNPRLQLLTERAANADEGCLSVPGHYFSRARFLAARVTGVDDRGRAVDVTGTGYLARCFQHEVDHLDGTLYVDGLTGDVRRLAQRTMREDPRLNGEPIVHGKRRRLLDR